MSDKGLDAISMFKDGSGDSIKSAVSRIEVEVQRVQTTVSTAKAFNRLMRLAKDLQKQKEDIESGRIEKQYGKTGRPRIERRLAARERMLPKSRCCPICNKPKLRWKQWVVREGMEPLAVCKACHIAQGVVLKKQSKDNKKKVRRRLMTPREEYLPAGRVCPICLGVKIYLTQWVLLKVAASTNIKKWRALAKENKVGAGNNDKHYALCKVCYARHERLIEVEDPS